MNTYFIRTDGSFISDGKQQVLNIHDLGADKNHAFKNDWFVFWGDEATEGNIKKQILASVAPKGGETKAIVFKSKNTKPFEFDLSLFNPNSRGISTFLGCALNYEQAVAFCVYTKETTGTFYDLVYFLNQYEIPFQETEFDLKPVNKPKFFPQLKNAFVHLFYWYFKLPVELLANKKQAQPSFSEKIYPRNQSVSRLIFLGLAGFLLVLMPYLSKDYGITWDERLQRDYGRDIVNFYQSGGKDTSIFNTKIDKYFAMLYYGCSFDVVSNYVFRTFFKNSDEFLVRHAINAIYGAVAIIYTGLLARLLLSNWLAGIISMVLLALSPSFFGHCMNNPKDIPFAASYVFGVYYLVRFSVLFPRFSFSSLLLSIIGIGWAISVRAGGLLLIPYSFMIFLLFNNPIWTKVLSGFNWKTALNGLIIVLVVSVLGYFFGTIIWPYAQKDLLNNPLIALNNMSKFQFLHTYEIFEGKRIYMSEVPNHYIIKLISITAPLLVIAGFVIGLGKSFSKPSKYNTTLLLLVLSFFPIFYAAYKDSTLYNGWRHFLFCYLTLAILSAWGWTTLFSLKKPILRVVSIACFALLTGKVLVWNFVNHPYESVYFNEIVGGTKGAYGNYEMDYYSNSVRKAAEWLVANEKNDTLVVATNNETLTLEHPLQKAGSKFKVRWTRDYERGKQPWDYAIFTCRTFSPYQIKHGGFPQQNCVYKVEVDGIPLACVIKRPDKSGSVAYGFLAKNTLDSAAVYFEKAIASDPENEEYYRMAGYSYLNMGNTEKAFTFLNQSVERNPDAYMTYYLRSYVWRAKNNFEQAEEDLKNAIKCKRNYPDAFTELGNMYMEKGYYSFASDAYQNAIGYGGASAADYCNYGKALIGSNDLERAVQVFENALGYDPRYIPALQGLVECYQKSNNAEGVARVKQYMIENNIR